MRTSPNIWLVFDGLRERTGKVPSSVAREEDSGGKDGKVRNGKEEGGRGRPRKEGREDGREDEGACYGPRTERRMSRKSRRMPGIFIGSSFGSP